MVATDIRSEAQATYRASLHAGEPMSGVELGDRFGRSASWGRAVAAEVRAESNGHDQPEASGAPGVASPRQADAGIDVASPVQAPVERQPGRSWQDSAITLVVALVAALASYRHMHDVAVMAGEPMWVARAFPVTVDGLVLAALRRGEHGRGWLLLGIVVSIAANVLAQFPEHAAEAGPVVSAWPPLALFGTHRLVQRR